MTNMTSEGWPFPEHEHCYSDDYCNGQQCHYTIATGDTCGEPLPRRQREQGLYGKYRVYRSDGRDQPGGDRHGASYFVLDVTHDPFALSALKAYAEACVEEYPVLANQLLDLVEQA